MKYDNPNKGAMMETTVPEEVELETADAPVSEGWVPCDTCQTAQAMWKVIGDSGTLYFCGHHKNKLEAGLTAWAKEFVEIVVL